MVANTRVELNHHHRQRDAEHNDPAGPSRSVSRGRPFSGRVRHESAPDRGVAVPLPVAINKVTHGVPYISDSRLRKLAASVFVSAPSFFVSRVLPGTRI